MENGSQYERCKSSLISLDCGSGSFRFSIGIHYLCYREYDNSSLSEIRDASHGDAPQQEAPKDRDVSFIARNGMLLRPLGMRPSSPQDLPGCQMLLWTQAIVSAPAGKQSWQHRILPSDGSNYPSL